MPWLPAPAGTIVGSATQSDAFLYDWRTTIADLQAQAYYGTIAERLHRCGLTYFAEALEDRRP